jgi:hypothetical protein
LVAETDLGRAGTVLGLEVSRLARNSGDWHRLFEICALIDTLICDEDGLYNPSDFNDRLLLGLKGTMSEAELHFIRARLRGGQYFDSTEPRAHQSLHRADGCPVRQRSTWLEAVLAQEIAVRLRLEFPGDLMMQVSHETIYQSLLSRAEVSSAGSSSVCLCPGRTARRPQGQVENRSKNAHMISERPAEIEDRAVLPGHCPPNEDAVIICMRQSFGPCPRCS